MRRNSLVFSGNFERHVENTMGAPVFVSAKQSEIRLRHDFSLPIIFPRSTHEERSNNILNVLISRMRTEADRIYNEDGWLYLMGENDTQADYALTSEARNIILQHNNTTLDKDLDPEILKWVQETRHALDVISALEELQTGTCHTLRIDMEKTGIKFYGLRDVMALLGHCVMIASSNGTLMTGVTPADALNALAHGIANCARGSNRDVPGATDDYDDLEDAVPECDRGCYNALLQSMAGILPQVTIIYHYDEAFNAFLQNAICETLVKHADSLQRANFFLNLWLTSTAPLYTQPLRYQVFVQEVRNNFANMTQTFAKNCCPWDALLAEEVVKYLEELAKNTKLNTGIELLDSVSPTYLTLQTQWEKQIAEQQRKRKYAELKV